MTTQATTDQLRHDWDNNPRWAGVTRPYPAEEVVRLRGTVTVEHSLAKLGADKLWNSLQREGFVNALGALTGNQAMQQVKAGLKAIYLSGWQVAADANLSYQTYPDQSLYPVNSVPAVVRRINNALLRADQIDRDPRARLRHGHGHTQEEMWAIKSGRIERVPDLIVRPESDAQVSAIVALAVRHRVCLIPYGGGTNVTEALRCPAGERRTIVSVDMRRMNRVVWIDPENRTACIEAGASGREIAEVLGRYGFTLGHEPDSYEFSTLGGWVATQASGMKKNRYGNIEDIVLGVFAMTAQGELARDGAPPRESVGGDPARWLFGSEGRLGIVTRAVVKVRPLPEVSKHG
ncbi:MAG: FAD-binding protein, partial [Burkholderiales bacterium]